MRLRVFGAFCGLLLLAVAAWGEVLQKGPATVQAESAAFLMSGQSGGELALALLPLPLQEEGTLALFLELEGRSLLAAAEGSPFFLDLFVYAVGERNRVLAHYNQRLEVRRDSASLERDGLALRLGLALEPGPCQLRVLARVGDTAFGLRSLPFTQPEPGQAVLLPPLVARPARGEGISLGEAIDLPVWPSARPLVVPGGAVEMEVRGADLPEGVPVARFRAGGEVRLERALEAVESEGDARLGRLSLADLEPGIYEVSLLLSPLASAAIEVFGAPPEHAGATLWMDLLASAEPGAGERAHREPTNTGGERLRRSELGTAYLDVLGRLAAGEADAARRQLLDYEERAVFGPRPPGEERLAKAQDEVLQDLAETAPEALLPVLWLHATAAEDHLRQNRYRLAVLSIGRLEGVAEAVGIVGEEDRARLADLFAALAASHRRRGDIVRARELFHRALTFDEGHAASLLGLAGLAERGEESSRAVELLVRLLEHSPGHGEARLRLAVNRQRLGQSLAARRALGDLRTQDPTWVAVLACQELAHLERRQGRAGTAVVVLEGCLERFPDHAGLGLQLLALLDREGDPRSTELLATLDRAAPSTAENERVRYNRWPEDDVRRGLEVTETVARARLEILASALRGLGEAGR